MESLAVSKKTDFTSCLNSVSAVGCIIPPIPPANSNITYDYDMARHGNHTILPFGHNVTYTCIDSRNFKFDEDYTKENFIVTCKDDGNWTDAHMPWTFCEDKRREYYLSVSPETDIVTRCFYVAIKSDGALMPCAIHHWKRLIL